MSRTFAQSFVIRDWHIKGFEVILDKLKTMPDTFTKDEYVKWMIDKVAELRNMYPYNTPKGMITSALEYAIEQSKGEDPEIPIWPNILVRDELIKGTELFLESIKNDPQYSIDSIMKR